MINPTVFEFSIFTEDYSKKFKSQEQLLWFMNKKNLDFSKHEISTESPVLLENPSRYFFEEPKILDKKLSLLFWKDFNLNPYNSNFENNLKALIKNFGYKFITNTHPSMLINSSEILSSKLLGDLEIPWYTSILLIDNYEYDLFSSDGDRVVYSLQRNRFEETMDFKLHKRIMNSDEEAILVEKII